MVGSDARQGVTFVSQLARALSTTKTPPCPVPTASLVQGGS